MRDMEMGWDDSSFELRCLRKIKFQSNIHSILDKYRYLSRIKRNLDENYKNLYLEIIGRSVQEIFIGK